MRLNLSRCLLFLVLLGLAPRALAADGGRVFDYRDVTLENGLRVLSLEDFSCPIVAVQLWYHVGSKDEQPDRQGFAHMFEHMMFRGTDRLGPTGHFDLVRRTGGDCNAYTSFDNTVYVQVVPANQLELVLWLEAERMAFLKIDQTAFDCERKVVEEERRLGINRPYGTIPERVLPELFKVHPYRWLPIGKIPHLRAAAVQELRDFWSRHYVPANATLVVVGAVKHEEVERLARRSFGWIPRYPAPERIAVREPPLQGVTLTLKDDNAPAPVVAAAWRTVPVGHEDAVGLELLATILGGGQSSRLYRKLVAEDQVAMLAMGGAQSLEHDGIFAAGAVLSPLGGSPNKVLELVKSQVERLRTEPVTEAELTKARNQMLAGLVRSNLNVASKATLLGSASVLEGDAGRVNRRLEAIRAVTLADLQRLARTYLAPERMVQVTVEQNILGSLLGKLRGSARAEEDAPITAKPETEAPPPGRKGLTRPRDFPAEPPVAGLLAAPPAFAHTSKVLPNGLKVLVVPNHEVPYISIQLGLSAGTWTEAKPGVASMALSMLTKGTTRRSEKELAEELEMYAISLGGSAGHASSFVTAGCLTEHIERTMALLGEVVLTPRFPADEFEKLRKQVRTGLAVALAEPSDKAERELDRRLYGSHPYGRRTTGEVADLDALKVDDLAPWWQTFVRPDEAVLIFAGDIEPGRAEQLAAQTFGSWKAAGPKPRVELPPLPKAEPTHIYLVPYNGVQSQIRIGQLVSLRRGQPEFATAEVVSSYFGGAFNSRLNEVLRVQKGLTYGASGGFSTFRFAGALQMSTFSKTESTVDAVRAALEELERLRKEPPTTKELEDTKSYFLGSFVRRRETPQQMASELWTIQSYGLPADHFEQTLQRVAQTDAAACQRLVRDLVDPGRLVVVVVGDPGKLQKDLEKVAPVTVVQSPGGAKP